MNRRTVVVTVIIEPKRSRFTRRWYWTVNVHRNGRLRATERHTSEAMAKDAAAAWLSFYGSEDVMELTR